MATTYKNAPLVELIVELRWHVATSGPPGAPQFVSNTSSTFDQWFSRLSAALENLGYRNLERLIPHDFPVTAFRPMYRYKRKSNESFPLIQFGHGIFTINAGPPNYIDWKSFRPEVETGIKALISSMPEDCGINKFKSASVRYIDAFNDELREGKPSYSFMKNDLNASINLPEEVFNLAQDTDGIVPTMALRFPVKHYPGHQFFLQIAAGQLNNAPATVMEMNYLVQESIPLAIDEFLGILDNSRNTLHDTFKAMTRSIHDRMRPTVTEEE